MKGNNMREGYKAGSNICKQQKSNKRGKKRWPSMMGEKGEDDKEQIRRKKKKCQAATKRKINSEKLKYNWKGETEQKGRDQIQGRKAKVQQRTRKVGRRGNSRERKQYKRKEDKRKKKHQQKRQEMKKRQNKRGKLKGEK